MVDASRDLSESDIYDGLISLKYGASSLPEWRIEGADTLILVSSLQSLDWYYADVEVGESLTTSSSADYVMWVTIPAELNASLQLIEPIADSVSLNTRLTELLGLRPEDDNSVVNLMWVNKNSLLRPSYDSDPTTTCGAITYPEVVVTEWYAEWFDETVEYSYESPTDGLNYPFTRLGYTYDWGADRPKYGLSEFIVVPSSEMILELQMGCWSYYNSLSD